MYEDHFAELTRTFGLTSQFRVTEMQIRESKIKRTADGGRRMADGGE